MNTEIEYPMMTQVAAKKIKAPTYLGTCVCKDCHTDKRRFRLNGAYVCASCYSGVKPSLTPAKVKSGLNKHNAMVRQKKAKLGGIAVVYGGMRT